MIAPRLAVAVLYLWSAVPALLLALPLGLLVGGIWGHHGGDALLWEAGGLPLLETVRLLAPSLSALAWGLPVLLLLWSLSGIIPQALALASLVPEERSPLERAAVALRSLPSLVFVTGAALLVRVVLAAVCLVFFRGLAPALAGFQEPGRSLALLPVVLLALVLLSLARVLHDLAAAAVVARGEGGSDALLSALDVLHRRLPRALGAWALRAVIGLLLIGLIAALGRWHEGAGLLATLLLHQGGLLALAWLRVGWFRKAIRLVERGGETSPPQPPSP